MERYKGSLEPWSCCTGGGCVLCDDERSCWEVAIFQVPTLLRDGGLLWLDDHTTGGRGGSIKCLVGAYVPPQIS